MAVIITERTKKLVSFEEISDKPIGESDNITVGAESDPGVSDELFVTVVDTVSAQVI